MRKLTSLLAASCLLFTASVSFAQNKNELLTRLFEAKDYVDIKPSYAAELLTAQKPKALSVDEQIEWHLTLVRAANKMANDDLAESALTHLFALSDRADFNKKLAPVLSGLGAWLHQSGHLAQAEQVYLCGISHTKNQKDKIAMLVNLGVVSRSQQDVKTALSINRHALKLAKQSEAKLPQALIENNLGVIALEQNNLELSKHHFSSALALNQDLDRLGGQVVSGLNLLYSYLLAKRLDLYERLQPRISSLVVKSKNPVRLAFLNLIHGAYQFRQGKALTAEWQAELTGYYGLLNDNSLQINLSPLVDELELHIPLPALAAKQDYQGDWLKLLDKQCNWPQLEKQGYSQLLTEKK